MKAPYMYQTIVAIAHAAVLSIACLISYLIMTRMLGHTHYLYRDDDLLGGMWAVAATVFVYHDRYTQSRGAAFSRMAATSISFVLCLAYLLIFPFHAWGMAMLIGIGAVIVTLIGQPSAGITTGITTAVIMVVAGISPHNAWLQPILRLLDTVVGVGVGLAAAWLGRHISGGTSPGNECKP
jgi:hypothetical protein